MVLLPSKPSLSPELDPIPCGPWLEHLRSHLSIARADRHPEGVHQVRAAAQRLRVWLRLARRRALSDDLAWLRAGCGRVRDLDVLLARELPKDFRDHLVAERARAREDLLETLDHPRLAGLLDALAFLPPAPRERLEKGVASLRRQVEKRGATVAGDGFAIDAYHSLRKSVRRLRFAREWLGHRAETPRSLQGALGEMNDAAVALDLLQGFPGRGSCAELARELADELRRRQELVRELWSATELSPDDS